MLVAVSVDTEGASQLRSVREIFGCMPEYWETGKPRLEAEVRAACEAWPDSRQPLAVAMSAALAPFVPYWLSGFGSADDAAAADQRRVGQLVTIFDAWAAETHPEWYTQPTDPFPAGVAERLEVTPSPASEHCPALTRPARSAPPTLI